MEENKIKKIIFLILGTIFILLMTSCSQESSTEVFVSKDEVNFEFYVDENNQSVTREHKRLYKVIIERKGDSIKNITFSEEFFIENSETDYKSYLKKVYEELELSDVNQSEFIEFNYIDKENYLKVDIVINIENIDKSMYKSLLLKEIYDNTKFSYKKYNEYLLKLDFIHE